jgi:thiol-disulfide isomerase/thioredoxin
MKVIYINRTNGNLLNDLNGSNNGTVLFYHPQCSHCIALKPQWEEMKRKIGNKNCNIYEVNGEDMDHIYHPMKETINGFPTILNVNNGKLTHFEEERNTANMLRFVLSNLTHSTEEKKNTTKKLNNRKVSFYLNKNEDLMKRRRVLQRNNILNSILLAKERMKKRQKNNPKKKTKAKKKPLKRKTAKRNKKTISKKNLKKN